MKKIVLKSVLILILLASANGLFAQRQTFSTSSNHNFWKNVQFGGGLGLSIGSGYSDVTISPSAIYNVNQVVSVGASLQFGYISAKNDFSSTLYGGSIIGLVNPFPEVQLSAELEEINVNTDYHLIGRNLSTSLWNTALYLGAGYRTGNVTIGIGYNVLQNDRYDSDPFVPFVRAYF